MYIHWCSHQLGIEEVDFLELLHDAHYHFMECTRTRPWTKSRNLSSSRQRTSGCCVTKNGYIDSLPGGFVSRAAGSPVIGCQNTTRSIFTASSMTSTDKALFLANSLMRSTALFSWRRARMRTDYEVSNISITVWRVFLAQRANRLLMVLESTDAITTKTPNAYPPWEELQSLGFQQQLVLICQ